MKIRQNISKLLILIMLGTGMCLLLNACDPGVTSIKYDEGIETRIFTDSCGREVEIPAHITRIAPSGANSQIVLQSLAPDLLVGISASPSLEQKPYLPDYLWKLPTFGQFYGSKANLNMEALIVAQPEVIIDLGDRKDTVVADMNLVQKQTDIATIFIECDLYHMEEAYIMLGDLLDRQEAARVLADYVKDALAMCRENSAKIPEENRKTVMYGTGSAGLACNARGSTQCYVLEEVGVENAIVIPEDELSNKGGGNTISMEQLYVFNPDIILLQAGGPFDKIPDYPDWQELNAVKNNEYYEIPMVPYCWLSNPPSVNEVLGLYWLGNLIYPEIYDYDMADKVMEYYQLFYQCNLTREEAESFLENSTQKMLKN